MPDGGITLALLITTMVLTVASAAMSFLMKPKGLKAQDQELTTRLGDVRNYVRILYGRCRAPLDIIYHNVDAADKYSYWIVGLLGHGEVESIDKVYFDNKLVYVFDADGKGRPVDSLSNVLSIYARKGGESQEASRGMTQKFPEWKSTAQGNGLAYLIINMYLDSKKYPDGVPGSIEVELKGKKVRDIRNVNWTTSAKAYSENPALCMLDYLIDGNPAGNPYVRYGIGVSSAEIDEQSWIDAANHCDELKDVLLSNPEAPTLILKKTQGGELKPEVQYQYAVMYYNAALDKHSDLGTPSSYITTKKNRRTVNVIVPCSPYSAVAKIKIYRRWNKNGVWQAWGKVATINNTVNNQTVNYVDVLPNSAVTEVPESGNTFGNDAGEGRYTLNGIFDPSAKESHMLLSDMTTSCMSSITYYNGKYSIHINKSEIVSSVALSDTDNIIGDVSVETPTESSISNYVKVNFINANKKFADDSITFPKTQTGNRYYAEDYLNQIDKTIDLPCTVTKSMALRIGQILRKESRLTTIVNMRCNQSAYALRVGDVVKVSLSSLGWVEKLMRIRKVAYYMDTSVGISAQEYDSNVYSDDLLDTDTYLTNTGLGDPLAPISEVSGVVFNDTLSTERDSVSINADVVFAKPTDDYYSHTDIYMQREGYPSIVRQYAFSGTTRDVSTNGVDGTLAGDATFIDSGRFGKSLYLVNTGGAGYSRMDSSTLSLTTGLTFGVWVKRGGADDTSSRAIILDRKFGVSNGVLLANYNGQYQYGLLTKTGGGVETSKILSVTPEDIDDWNHVVITYDSATGLQALYINGLLADSYYHPAGNTVKYLTPTAFGVGNEYNTSGTQFIGSVDSLIAYDMAVSASDAMSLYTSGAISLLPTNTPLNPVRCYTLALDGVDTGTDEASFYGTSAVYTDKSIVLDGTYLMTTTPSNGYTDFTISFGMYIDTFSSGRLLSSGVNGVDGWRIALTGNNITLALFTSGGAVYTGLDVDTYNLKKQERYITYTIKDGVNVTAAIDGVVVKTTSLTGKSYIPATTDTTIGSTGNAYLVYLYNVYIYNKAVDGTLSTYQYTAGTGNEYKYLTTIDKSAEAQFRVSNLSYGQIFSLKFLNHSTLGVSDDLDGVTAWTHKAGNVDVMPDIDIATINATVESTQNSCKLNVTWQYPMSAYEGDFARDLRHFNVGISTTSNWSGVFINATARTNFFSTTIPEGTYYVLIEAVDAFGRTTNLDPNFAKASFTAKFSDAIVVGGTTTWSDIITSDFTTGTHTDTKRDTYSGNNVCMLTQNMLTNPDFGTGDFTGWTPSNCSIYTMQFGGGGSPYACKGASGVSSTVYQSASVVKDKKYVGGGNLWRDPGTETGYYLQIGGTYSYPHISTSGDFYLLRYTATSTGVITVITVGINYLANPPWYAKGMYFGIAEGNYVSPKYDLGSDINATRSYKIDSLTTYTNYDTVGIINIDIGTSTDDSTYTWTPGLEVGVVAIKTRRYVRFRIRFTNSGIYDVFYVKEGFKVQMSSSNSGVDFPSEFKYDSISSTATITGTTNITGATTIDGSTSTTGNITHTSSSTFEIKNSSSNEDVNIITSGTGLVKVNGKRLGYYINVHGSTRDMIASTVMYFGSMADSPKTTAGYAICYIPVSGTITEATIQGIAGTAGSSQSWTMYIRKNDSSDTSIASVASSSAERVWRNTGLSIDVAAGDYIEIKSGSVAWGTVPQSIRFGGYVFVAI